MECVEHKKWSLYLQTLFSERGVSVLPNWSLSKLGFYPPQKPRDETLSSLILWCDYVKGTAPRSWRKTVPGCKTFTKICSKLSSQRRKRKDVQFQQLQVFWMSARGKKRDTRGPGSRSYLRCSRTEEEKVPRCAGLFPESSTHFNLSRGLAPSLSHLEH